MEQDVCGRKVYYAPAPWLLHLVFGPTWTLGDDPHVGQGLRKDPRCHDPHGSGRCAHPARSLEAPPEPKGLEERQRGAFLPPGHV